MVFKTSPVFTLPNPTPLEKSIAKKLDKNFARNVEWRRFSNGEWMLRILKTSKTAVVLGRTDAPGDNLLQTLTLIDSLKRNGTQDITLVIPYFGYSRQDHVVRRGDHLPSDLFIKLFQSCGATSIVTIDLHNPLTAKRSPIPLTSIDFIPALASEFKKILSGEKQLTIVSPDRGSKSRAKQFRDHLDPSLPVCWLDKHRDQRTGIVHSRKLFGQKQGTTSLIVDDICDTGGTIKECVRQLKKNGFKTFYLRITHPVFSANATQTLRALKFKKIFVSNTVPLSPKIKHSLPITVVDATQSIINMVEWAR